jgi:hypothetical protein
MILGQSVKADNHTDDSKGIKNQYIVVLKSTASNQILNLLVEELTAKGVKIIAIYDQPILKGFAFSSDNTTLTNNIIDYLNNQTEVEYVISDKEAVIF